MAKSHVFDRDAADGPGVHFIAWKDVEGEKMAGRGETYSMSRAEARKDK